MRGARLRWLGVVVLAAMSLAACGQQGQSAERAIPGASAAVKPAIPGTFTQGSLHKLQASPAEAEALRAQGAHLIADYGSYQLLAIDDAQLAKVKPSAAL